jgi:hypothetical protein
MTGLTNDIRPMGTVRAFEPRIEKDWRTKKSAWKCRGRVSIDPPTRDGNTRQCKTTLSEDWDWCPKCGGIIAWGGFVMYKGTRLKHLERTSA